ncbi:hypothetical protein TWF281_008600 [Arthrobotrys megalospora]
MDHRLFVISALFHFLSFSQLSHAASQYLLARDRSGTIPGFEGLSYQAIRWEPLCGNLGTAEGYRQVYEWSPFCRPAIEVFTNITDNFGLYDRTGLRLRGQEARIGAGIELCLCFALRQIQDKNLAGAYCIYVNGNAQAYLDGNIALNYRPGVDVDRALPICGGGFDVEAARESWSKTAVQPQVTEIDTTLGSLETIVLVSTLREEVSVTRVVTEAAVPTEYSVSTYIPSVVPYTDTTLYTTTGTDGVVRTITSARITQLPVITVSATPQGGNKGLSQSDKVTLGVGLGLGLPAFVVMTAGLFVGIALLRHRYGARKQASDEAGVEA